MQAVSHHASSAMHIAQFNNWVSEWIKFKARKNVFRGLDKPYDVDVEQIKDGDIFLLSPTLLGGANRPLMVMVMSDNAEHWGRDNIWSNTSCTVITPLSPLSKPAFSYELDVDDGHILQLWNTRCIPDKYLANAWKVGEADQQTLDDAYDVHLHYGGDKLPKHLENRVFIPSPADDLHLHTEYYNEEMELADNLEL